MTHPRWSPSSELVKFNMAAHREPDPRTGARSAMPLDALSAMPRRMVSKASYPFLKPKPVKA